jgi:comEA protein
MRHGVTIFDKCSFSIQNQPVKINGLQGGGDALQIKKFEAAAVLATLAFCFFAAGFFVGRGSVEGVVKISPQFVEHGAQGAEISASAASGATSVPPAGPVDINTAAEGELMTLPGVGEVLARRIVDYRTEHGAFQSVEDLQNVYGIGEAKLEGMRAHITLGHSEGRSPD